MSQVEALLEESIDVDATPERVWSLVTDLPRMARWSPQVVRTVVRGGGPVQLGTRAVNVNRKGVLVWPTRSNHSSLPKIGRMSSPLNGNSTNSLMPFDRISRICVVMMSSVMTPPQYQ